MKKLPQASKQSVPELRQLLFADKRAITMAVVASAGVNILFLTGPLFMMQVYDRVLASSSLPTLIVLFGLVCGLFLFMGGLDYLRGRITARIGCWLQEGIGRRTFLAMLQSAGIHQLAQQRQSALMNLQIIRRFLGSPLPFAFADAPWSIVFFAVLFLMHTWFGILAVIGAVILLFLAILNQKSSRDDQQDVQKMKAEEGSFQQSILADQDAIKGLGMQQHMLSRWRQRSDNLLDSEMNLSDRSGAFSITIKTLRLWLQSAMLALGAYLVLQGAASPGSMITASIIMGRALSPLEQLVNQWQTVIETSQAYKSLNVLLQNIPEPVKKVMLPAPEGNLTVSNVSVRYKRDAKPNLQSINLELHSGEVMGVLGATGSGKSTLCKVVAGVSPMVAGEIRYDGATRDQWLDDELGQYVGYLPQNVALFEGSIAENIARMQPEYSDEQVIAAAQLACVHEMILSFPEGYNTPIGPRGEHLSGGQGQLIALARAFYGSPRFVILDEPNSHLDHEGEKIITQAIQAIKESGATVIVTAHRTSILPVCDKLLVIDQGNQVAFGPRDSVLQQTVQNHQAMPTSQEA